MRERPRGVAGFLRRRLQRRLFVWFALAIFVAMFAGVVASSLGGAAPGAAWRRDWGRLRNLASDQLARVWDDPPARDALAKNVAERFDLSVNLVDVGGRPLAVFGGRCGKHGLSTDVRRGHDVLGRIVVCGERVRPGPARILAPVAAVALVLWLSASLLARRLARPFHALSRVAEDLGRGRLGTRITRTSSDDAEVAAIADALNDLAARAEKQLETQRALLAAVSHEIRTPLARMRLLTELSRGGDASALDKLDAEVAEVDALVADLLAGSRLDFGAESPVPVDLGALAADVLDKRGVDVTRLSADVEDRVVLGDPALLGRAIGNLVSNAEQHGEGLLELTISSPRPGVLRVEARDRGPGVDPADASRIFEPFGAQRAEGPGSGGREKPGSVGLGLSLVRRIAEAHGGGVFARAADGGGAIIGFDVRRSPAVDERSA
ncbi:MAG: HAMP domain-containing histidine kinase [Polyangiaceae bacterium]|nr:HAMP domain-containing histidine kinase [Polyangiaceae bacterium]